MSTTDTHETKRNNEVEERTLGPKQSIHVCLSLSFITTCIDITLASTIALLHKHNITSQILAQSSPCIPAKLDKTVAFDTLPAIPTPPPVPLKAASANPGNTIRNVRIQLTTKRRYAAASNEDHQKGPSLQTHEIPPSRHTTISTKPREANKIAQVW